MDRLHVKVKGRVQGVGFRYSAQRQAESLGLSGWVRNLGDGETVEAEFEGERSQLKKMLQWCRSGPTFASVDDVETDWESGESKYSGVSIRW